MNIHGRVIVSLEVSQRFAGVFFFIHKSKDTLDNVNLSEKNMHIVHLPFIPEMKTFPLTVLIVRARSDCVSILY